jgi:hypothetical protein
LVASTATIQLTEEAVNAALDALADGIAEMLLESATYGEQVRRPGRPRLIGGMGRRGEQVTSPHFGGSKR